MKQDHLFEETLALFTPDAIERASQRLGEDQQQVALAVSGLVPYILEAARQNADSAALKRLVNDYRDDAAFSDPTELLNSNDYIDWLSDNEDLTKTVFGDNEGAVMQEISEKSGLRPDSTKRLALTAIPAALGMIGRAFRPGAIPGTDLPPYFV